MDDNLGAIKVTMEKEIYSFKNRTYIEISGVAILFDFYETNKFTIENNRFKILQNI